jgi:hypothetical protein
MQSCGGHSPSESSVSTTTLDDASTQTIILCLRNLKSHKLYFVLCFSVTNLFTLRNGTRKEWIFIGLTEYSEAYINCRFVTLVWKYARYIYCSSRPAVTDVTSCDSISKLPCLKISSSVKPPFKKSSQIKTWFLIYELSAWCKCSQISWFLKRVGIMQYFRFVWSPWRLLPCGMWRRVVW